jgi:hypothetical protein
MQNHLTGFLEFSCTVVETLLNRTNYLALLAQEIQQEHIHWAIARSIKHWWWPKNWVSPLAAQSARSHRRIPPAARCEARASMYCTPVTTP